jgi:tetratricopeptide (TPR) repeat protein
MPITQHKTAWLLLLALSVPALVVAQARGKLVARIHDPEGQPIEGVTVTVTSPQVPGYKDIETTDKKGVFSVEFPKLDVTYHYRFDKIGYQSVEADQNWSLEGTGLFDWTMKPGESAAAVAAGPPPASTSEEAILAFNAGISAYNAKDYATTAKKMTEALSHDPKLRRAWEVLALAQIQLGHYKETADAAEKAMALGSQDAEVLQARWQAYRELKDDAKAAAALKDLDKAGKDKDEAKKFHNKGVELLKAKDYAGAFEQFQSALKLDPDLTESQIGMAEAATRSGHYAEGEAAAEAVLKDDPHNEQAIRLRYNAALGLGNTAKLSEALVGIAPLEPAIARNGLLKIAFDAYDANKMKDSKAAFEKLISVEPSYALPYYYVGVIDIGLGESADAKSHLERFLQLAPSDKEAQSAREMLKYLDKP